MDSRDCSLIKQQSVTYIFLTHGIRHFKAKQSEVRDTCQTIPTYNTSAADAFVNTWA